VYGINQIINQKHGTRNAEHGTRNFSNFIQPICSYFTYMILAEDGATTNDVFLTSEIPAKLI